MKVRQGINILPAHICGRQIPNLAFTNKLRHAFCVVCSFVGKRGIHVPFHANTVLITESNVCVRVCIMHVAV